MDMKPLNIFQRVMRGWDETYPYNAAQVLRLAGPAHVEHITDAWNQVLSSSGLGVAHVRGRRFGYAPAPRQEVAIVDADLGLEGHITSEMNRPFVEPRLARYDTSALPFRPFVLPGRDSHYLGLTYQHWVADSVSVRMLLREWFCLLHHPAGLSNRPLHLPSHGLWHYFGPRPGRWNLPSGIADLLRSTTQFSRARKIDKDCDGQHVACSLHSLPEGMVDRLLEAARNRGVTLNDLFTAALARACDAYGANPRYSERDLALGSIVDLRPMSPENLENTFSLFLGFTAVVLPARLLRQSQGCRDQSGGDELLASIAAQHTQQKNRRAALSSVLRMGVGYAQGRCLSQRQLAKFYRNYMALSGGLSNVNMNRSWATRYHPEPLLEYLRVAPTGPMVPLVIAVTTIGRQLTFVLTRRASLVDDAHAAELARMFIDDLTSRAQTA